MSSGSLYKQIKMKMRRRRSLNKFIRKLNKNLVCFYSIYLSIEEEIKDNEYMDETLSRENEKAGTAFIDDE